jgi:alpha-L-rhamnosidase
MKLIILRPLFFFGFVLAVFFWSVQPLFSGVLTTNLLCGFWQNPLGVDEASPRLSWQLQATLPEQRGEAQTAYQILVASSTNVLAENRGDLWDSGKIISDSSLNISYAGQPLISAQQVFWKVRVWDQKKKISDWSSAATWTMGLLNSNDWKGMWLCAPTNSPLPIFRREFTVKPGLQRALIFICGLGQYELSANGAKVGDDFLSPGWSKYDQTCLYDTLDLTSSLNVGTNALGVMLGNGMYNVEPGKRYTKFTGSFGPPTLIAQIELFYADGTSEVIASDAQWRTSPGPISFSGIYGGEDFDARRVQTGWDKINFDDFKWSPAIPTNGPGGKLCGLSCAAPPLREFEIHSSLASWKLTNGDVVFDLGQNASHVPKVSVSGPAGSKVWLMPSELTNSSGSIYQHSMGGNGTSIRCEFIKATDGIETWSPQFFYAGYRYMQVRFFPANTNNSELPRVESLAGIVVNSDSTPVGEFACSNDLFNRIHTLIRWAQRANLVSVITDCPHRERLGWLEQYHLNGPSLRYEFDLAQLFTKGMNDMADSQLADGLVPDIAPEYPVFGGPFRDSPEWGSSFVIVPWQQYQFTGDRELLRRYYDGMKRYVAYLGSKSKNNIVSYGLGDWYDIGPGEPGPSKLTPNALTATAFYFYDTWILAQTAAMLDKTDEAKKFTAQADEIRAAFNAKFYNAAKHFYATDSQTANSIPLVMNLCDPTSRADVLNAIVANVRQHGNSITAGDVGYRYLLRALAEGGRSDVIFDMNNQSEKPGYGYQLKMGATSLTEAWDANPSSSQDHFMLGQILEWFYADLAGIGIDPQNPGFKNVLIRPQPVGDVTWVKAAYNSVHGRIVCDWKKADGKFYLNLEIPANATATVFLPATNPKKIFESGKRASKAPGVHFLRMENDRTVYEIASGNYQFTVE